MNTTANIGNTSAKGAHPLSGYIAGLDGVRALSVAIVILSHAGLEYTIPGGLGVTIFFAISGFLITNLLLTEMEKTQRINLSGFYVRRFLRLGPELLAFIIVTSIFGLIMGWQAGIWERLATIFYFFNYFYVFGIRHEILIEFPWRQLWSLSVEEHFYLFFPAMLLFVVRWKQGVLYAIIALVVIPLIWRLFLHYKVGVSSAYLYVATDTRIDSIAWGCLLAVLLRQRLAKGQVVSGAVFIRPLAMIAGVAMILFSLVYRDPDFRWTLRFSLQGVALFLIFANLLFDARWAVLVKAMEWGPIRYLGRISYGAYLWHSLVIRLLQEALPNVSAWTLVPTTFVLTILVAGVSYRLIDDPMKKWRKRFGSHVGYRN